MLPDFPLDMPNETYPVLVADDEPTTVESIVAFLDDREVAVVRRDSDVFETLETADVAVLDPDLVSTISNRVVAEIRPPAGQCTAVVVSDTDPDDDAIHLTRCESLDKPLTRRALRKSLDRLRTHARYDELLAEYAAVAAKRGALDASHTREELNADSEYAAIDRRVEELLAELESIATEFDAADFDAAFATSDFAGESRRQRIEWPA